MGIDKINIDAIANEKVKQVAEKCNVVTPEDRDLTGAEITVFEARVNKELAGGVAEYSRDDVASLLGWERQETTEAKEPTSAVTNPVKSEKPKTKAEKQGLKYAQKKAEKELDNCIKSGMTYNQIIAQLSANYANYPKIVEEIQSVSKMIERTKYNSKDEIESLDDTLESEFKADKDLRKRNGFKHKIYNKFKEEAKKDQINKEYAEIVRIFENEVKPLITPTDIKNHKGETYEVYEEKLKQTMKSINLMYEDKYGKTKESSMWDYSYYGDEAFKKFKNEYLTKLAFNATKEREKASSTTTEKKVVAEMKGTEKKDDYVKKAVKQLKKEGAVQTTVNHNTFKERYKELATISESEMREALGKDLYNKLNLNGHLKSLRNENGKYNLQSIADNLVYINKRTGADFELSASKDREMSETKFVGVEFKELFGQDFSDKEIKKIVDFIGINPQGKDHSFKTAAKDTLPGALASAISGAVFAPHVRVADTLNLTLSGISSSQIKEITSQLGANAQITQLQDKVNIKVEDITTVNLKALGALGGVAISLAVQIALAMLFGKARDEVSCLSVSDFDPKNKRYTDLESFKKYVQTAHPDKAEIICFLADNAKDKDGNFDADLLYSWMNAGAGVGSRRNQQECAGMSLYYDEFKPDINVNTVPKGDDSKVPDNDIKKDDKKDDIKKDDDKKDDKVKTTECKVEVRGDIKLDGTNDTPDSKTLYWDEIINMYYSDCLKENGGTHTMKEIRFALKRYNHIPLDHACIPSGLLCPQNLFGDDECERTKKKEITASPIRAIDTHDADEDKTTALPTRNAQYQFGINCGNSKTTWSDEVFDSFKAAWDAGIKILLGN